MIFRPDGSICFVDFEYCGWDDPLRLLADMLSHDSTRLINSDLKQFTVDYYLKNSKLSDDILMQFPVVMKLMSIEWLCVHLAAMTRAKIKSRQFSTVDFNLDDYLKEQITKATNRYNELFS